MDQQLLVFVTVVEKKNFSRAAESLHMTQPAVSQYIKSIEQRVNTLLLYRNNKVVSLTKAGEIVYYHAKEITAIYARMQTLVDDLMNTASGKLSIGSSYTFGEYVLPHIIATLHRHFPDITPSIKIGNTRDIADQVINNLLDVGIVEGDVSRKKEKLYIEPFAEDTMVIIVPANHPLAKKAIIHQHDLVDETWILREPGSGTREMTEHMLAQSTIEPRATMSFGSTQLIKEAVEAGLGISFLSLWTIQKELALGTLKIVKLNDKPFKRNFHLLTQITPFETKATDVFLHLLRTDIPSRKLKTE